MARTQKRSASAAPPRRALTVRGIAPADIDEKWLETMVKRLFAEMTRQLENIETGSAETPSERAADARTLAALERTLERLVKLDQQRAPKREKKVRPEDARNALHRKIARLTAAGTPAASAE